MMKTHIQKIDAVKNQGTKSDLVKTLGDLGERTMRSNGERHFEGTGVCVGRNFVWNRVCVLNEERRKKNKQWACAI